MADRGKPAPERERWAADQEIKHLNELIDQYEADMRLIEQAGQALGVGSAQLELEQLCQTIYEQVCQALPVDAFLVVLAEPPATAGRLALFIDNGIRYPPRDQALGPLLRRILDTGQPLLFADVSEEGRSLLGQQPAGQGQQARRARSWLGVPMTVRGQVKGILSAQNYQAGLYGPRERRLLSLIASQAAVATETARLFRQVQQTVEELSTPIIPVHEGVLVMPLVGAVDSRRAERIVETLLAAIERHGARVVLLDVTGVTVADTRVAQHLLRAARAARLLGSHAILTGVQPEVAETLVTLGVDMAELVTRSDLQAGIEFALGVTRRR